MKNQRYSLTVMLVLLAFVLTLAACQPTATRSTLGDAVSTETEKSSTSTESVASESLEETVASTETIAATQEIFTPELSVEVLVSGLDHPWDIGQLPDGSLVITERYGAVSLFKDGQLQHIADIEGVAAFGEGGLTGLAVDVDFSANQFIYLAYNTLGDNGPEVKVTRFVLSEELTLEEPFALVEGIPAIGSGRHSGCQIEMGADGAIWIGTGDAATSTTPQDPKSLGGKILRVTREGGAWPGNLSDPFDPRIFSYGHRNTQGLALFEFEKDGSFGFSAEHGSNIEDEINPLVKGNFGWSPKPPYNEAVPMTDFAQFPDAIAASWNSGQGTIAISGIALLKGQDWGTYEGSLAVSVLKGRHLRLISFDNGQLSGEEVHFEGEFGRLRASVLGQVDGHLYLTTDNGNDDAIIKISPKSKLNQD